ncbi:uncharacterized protein B0T15DRAFT_215669 [Chaetomium strumarium]|uniref:Transcriptional regulator n=1 Tax=Chaetomium strumarium TaxID=1170767 RepID=A0AAJ0GTX2_9PEZI|nr:hypothetical protein B0T15DRAFT_215669 [Chaetomium strumarium]
MGNKIARQLAKVVREIYSSDERDQLTVNYARQVAERRLKLEEGFFKDGEWKAKSKNIILDTMAEIEAESSDEATPAPKKKAAAAPKRSIGAGKRQKKDPASPETSDASDVGGAPEPPAKKRKTAPKTKRESKVESDDEQSDDTQGESVQPSPEPGAKPRSRQPEESSSELSELHRDLSEHVSVSERKETPKPATDDDESELSSVVDEPPKRKQKPKTTPKSKASPPPTEPKNDDGAADSSSELSSVIDEPQPPKRKRKTNKDTTAPPKQTRPTKAKSSSATAEVSPDEAQIKTLQSQLVKCGVRKVWGNEFKRHGADTPKAKIKHLKNMLVEIGMTGRFSDAKAREIKEKRELQADLQEVMQREKQWGVGGGRGEKRRAAAAAVAAGGRGKSLKAKDAEESGEGEEDEDEGKNEGESGESEGDEKEGRKLAVHRKGPAKRRPDLAFLEDESESE